MLDTNRIGAIGRGKALPVPGDVCSVQTAAGDYTGVVTTLVATRTQQQWTVETDDGLTVIVSDRSAITLTDERHLPFVQRGDRWVLDVRNLMARRERQEAGQ